MAPPCSGFRQTTIVSPTIPYIGRGSYLLLTGFLLPSSRWGGEPNDLAQGLAGKGPVWTATGAAAQATGQTGIRYRGSVGYPSSGRDGRPRFSIRSLAPRRATCFPSRRCQALLVSEVVSRTLWIGATLALVTAFGPVQRPLARPACEIGVGRIHDGSPATLGKSAGDQAQLAPTSSALEADNQAHDGALARSSLTTRPAPARTSLTERLLRPPTRAPPLG